MSQWKPMEQRRQGVAVAQQGGVGTYRLESSTKHATSELLKQWEQAGHHEHRLKTQARENTCKMSQGQ